MANEKRLIDANALTAEYDRVHIGEPGKARKLMEDAPTIDAVEVVRCKDCKYGDWDSEPDDAMVCMRTKDGFWRSGNDFCSYGERKEDDD